MATERMGRRVSAVSLISGALLLILAFGGGSGLAGSGPGAVQGTVQVADTTQTPEHPHDLAIVSIKAPKTVALSAKKPAVVKKVVVAIQNRSPYIETIQDLDTLTRLVSLSVVPTVTEGNCAAFLPVLNTDKLQRRLPLMWKPKKTMKMDFYVVFTCANDPLNGAGHEDYSYSASIDASAIDGQQDLNRATDTCPRAPVTGGADPFPDVSITDRGCGARLPDKLLGGDVLTDVVAKDAFPTYAIAGVVTRPVSGAVVPGVTVNITLFGVVSTSTTTDSNGEYRFSGLPPGAYSVTPDVAGVTLSPRDRYVEIYTQDVTGADFIAAEVSLLASGLEFLPNAFSSADQLRASLVASGDAVFFTDSTDQPLKKISLTDLSVTPLAQKIGAPESVFVHGEDVFWVDGGRLNVTALDGTQTTLLASGERDTIAGSTADVVVDEANAYWVNTVSSPDCSPSCTWIIQRVPLAGAPPVTLATVNRRVAALAADASNIYWEEASIEPWSPECECGSTIKMVPKSGGQTVVLVDGRLNGTMPDPPPGYTPGSWLPTGGLVVDGSTIVFGVAGNSYQIASIPVAGGAISTLASVPTGAGYALNSVRNIRVDSANAYWIDSGNRTLARVPLAGGDVTTLAGNLDLPGDLNTAASLAITADSAYWTEPGTIGGCCLQIGSGRIRTVSLSGGPVSTVVSDIDNPRSLAVDPQYFVWAENWRVAKSPLAGGSTSTLASGVTTRMARIVADQGSIYILDDDYIKKLPITGGTIEKLASAHGGNIGDFSVQNQDLVTDGSNVYWTSAYAGMGAPTVQKVPTAGGAAVTLATPQVVGAGPQDCFWRVAVDAQNVYWSASSAQFPIGCAVNKVPINGGAATTLVDQAYLHDFTVDGTDVYFSDGGSVMKIPVDGGSVTTVASGVGAWVLANDVNHIYWIDEGPAGGIGQLAKNAQPGGADAALLTGPLATDPALALEGIAIGGGGLFWTETLSGDIYSLE